MALARSVRASASRRKQREAALTALVDTAHDLTSPYDIDGLLRLITRRPGASSASTWHGCP
ncbi:hypothetical protein ACFSNO_19790 [Streptomyces cirratus]